eukprot:COSAG01_NODE_473_length_16542_cov_42.403651_12_plen_157_part_00
MLFVCWVRWFTFAHHAQPYRPNNTRAIELYLRPPHARSGYDTYLSRCLVQNGKQMTLHVLSTKIKFRVTIPLHERCPNLSNFLRKKWIPIMKVYQKTDTPYILCSILSDLSKRGLQQQQFRSKSEILLVHRFQSVYIFWQGCVFSRQQKFRFRSRS